MLKTDPAYQTYIDILQEELVPATGCTEPICIAYGAAKARELLGETPQRVVLTLSGNILKNVKSVVVPGTNGLKGVRAAAAAGIAAGDAEAKLQVISHITAEDCARIAAYLDQTVFEVRCADTPIVFDVLIEEYAGAHCARLRIVNSHTNIVLLQKDDKVLLDLPVGSSSEANLTDKSLLNVRDIVDFADTVELADVRPVLARWIEYNSAISAEGLKNDWGANIGKILLGEAQPDLKLQARAAAAAGSDARMSGCEMPVVILSGSGNQGITASLPVITYAHALGAAESLLLRALVVSALVTVQQKTGIGRLSAYCGATSAGAGAGAGIAYLYGGKYEEIAHTVVNAVAILSGMVCDGAKPSCAAKIAAAVDAGILGYQMYAHDRQFYAGEGFLSKGVDKTIDNVGRVARAMRETDKAILEIMTEN